MIELELTLDEVSRLRSWETEMFERVVHRGQPTITDEMAPPVFAVRSIYDTLLSQGTPRSQAMEFIVHLLLPLFDLYARMPDQQYLYKN